MTRPPGNTRHQPRPSAAAANHAIRDYVRGRAIWSPAARTELHRLWALYTAAQRRETSPSNITTAA